MTSSFWNHPRNHDDSTGCNIGHRTSCQMCLNWTSLWSRSRRTMASNKFGSPNFMSDGFRQAARLSIYIYIPSSPRAFPGAFHGATALAALRKPYNTFVRPTRSTCRTSTSVRFGRFGSVRKRRSGGPVASTWVVSWDVLGRRDASDTWHFGARHLLLCCSWRVAQSFATLKSAT